MSQGSGKHGNWARTEDRVTQVYVWMVAGATTPQIHDLANDEEHAWDVSPRTVRTYIAKARERFIAHSEVVRQEELGKAIARLDSLYLKCVTVKDNRGALAVEKQRIDLLGLSAPARIEVTEILSVVEAEIARRKREIAELERQYDLEPAPDPGA